MRESKFNMKIDRENGLPNLKRREVNKSFDYGIHLYLLLDDSKISKDKKTIMPWYHPNRSIRPSQIVNIFEDSTISLKSQMDPNKGIFSGIRKFSENNENNYSTSKNRSFGSVDEK